jgi:hypothetical protein
MVDTNYSREGRRILLTLLFFIIATTQIALEAKIVSVNIWLPLAESAVAYNAFWILVEVDVAGRVVVGEIIHCDSYSIEPHR